MVIQRINPTGSSRPSDFEPRPVEKNLFSAIFGQILLLFQSIGNLFSGNKTMKNRTVSPDPVNNASARRVTKAANRPFGVGKSTSTSVPEAKKSRRRRKVKPAEAPTTTGSTSRSSSRSSSPEPFLMASASRAMYEKEQRDREESKTMILPILQLASKIKEEGFHTKGEVKVHEKLLRKQADLKEKYGLEDLVGPLTLLESAIKNSLRK